MGGCGREEGRVRRDAAAVRRGWRDPYEWTELSFQCEELSRPVAGHHLTEVETEPPIIIM